MVRTLMADTVEQRIASLHQLSTQQLRQLWTDVFKSDAHPRLRKNLLVPVLAFRIQEQAAGNLRAGFHKRLTGLTADAKFHSASGPKPGTRLVREWRGKTHIVTVGENGYDYQGRRFDSLSEIARQITATRWSGPLFFGLREKQPKQGVSR
jgi:Protein of unknown function (DUF2924)